MAFLGRSRSPARAPRLARCHPPSDGRRADRLFEDLIVIQVCGLIPAYEPQPAVLDAARGLLEGGLARLVVVDDGSRRAGTAEIFQALRELPRTEVLVHPQNRGKGAALRTGLAHIQATATSSEVGAVTLDADGQHAVEDVLAVAGQLEKHPHELVLGCRSFDEACVPLPRKIGSVFQRLVTFLLLFKDIRDVQTGMRGIPFELFADLLDIKADRFEWEMEMIWRCRNHRIRQIRVQSIYIGKNESSHFHPVLDTIKFYGRLMGLRWRSLFQRSGKA